MLIEVYQHDWIPGWAAFRDDQSIQADGKAHVAINIGSLMAAVETGDLDKADVPYIIAESLMHEVVHCLESWAGVEFNEDRVEAILAAYREKYGRPTVWLPDSVAKQKYGWVGRVRFAIVGLLARIADSIRPSEEEA